MSFTLSALLALAAGHLVSWNIEFPRSRGQVLWRVCSVGLIVLGVRHIVWSYYFYDSDALSMPHPFYWLCTISYVIARFILAFLLVYSFSSLPAGVYDTKDIGWLNFVPFLH